jgi:chemotaxis protein MotA
LFVIVGIVVVTVAILGGFAMEKGPFGVLLQPAELVIIGGSALGTVFIGTPPIVLKSVPAKLMKIFVGVKYSKKSYLELLTMLYEIFVKARKDGLIGLEGEVTKPAEGTIFPRYPNFLRNHHALDFFCDTMKLLLNGVTDPFELEKVMDAEIETHHEEGGLASSVFSKVGDSLPGLGIVAAVLGIVITVQAIDGPPEEIGHKVGAALVGTFLGILLSYGYVQPIGVHLEHIAAEETKYLQCIKSAMISFSSGANPLIAIEFARKSIFSFNRPSSNEMEEACKQAKAANKQ